MLKDDPQGKMLRKLFVDTIASIYNEVIVPWWRKHKYVVGKDHGNLGYNAELANTNLNQPVNRTPEQCHTM